MLISDFSLFRKICSNDKAQTPRRFVFLGKFMSFLFSFDLIDFCSYVFDI